MNIVIDIRPLMEGKISGVEVYLLHLLDELFKIDDTNTYILFANAQKDVSGKIPSSKKGNVTVIQTRIPNKILNIGLCFFRYPKLDKLILNSLNKHPKKIPSSMKKNKIDLFFMPDLRPSALQKDVKKITVIHDLSFQHYKNFFSLKTRLWYKILNPKREIQTSNHLIAVSQYTKNDLLNTYRINENKITVIYEGIAKPITNITLADIRDRYKLPEKYFLFLSTIEPRKNIKNLIFGFLIYKKANPKDEIKLVIAGTENKKIFSKVSYDKHPDIHFTGFIDEKDKALLIKNAEAFVYPSFFEGFGLPLLEAMQAETPIITSHTSSMPEIAGDAAIFIDPAFPETIAQALEKIKDPALKNELKKNMKKQLEKFSWKKCAEETLMLFK